MYVEPDVLRYRSSRAMRNVLDGEDIAFVDYSIWLIYAI
jgi:hypothetical protein